MRRSVVAVFVLGQPSLTMTEKPQRQLCGTVEYSRCRPSGDSRSKRQHPFGRLVGNPLELECITM